MKMRELEIQFQNAMNELQASFEQQHREWQHSYQALQQLLEEAKQREAALLEEAKRREAALRAQNEQLARKLSTASSVPEQHALVKQIKMLGAHLDALAKDAATFNHHLRHQQRAADNFSGEQR
ncbi:MbeD/MobD like [Serratia entomophila]|uniref:MbeD/MobD family mobilization/exclusion protein n=1 Tax=Serratia entomophila TaxID=42906 RepID=UPI001F3E0AEE|nr:MbeD/MobD family mobilization/exclusion protein [Serratia entomophila]UIW17424.1 MbeD/MobD like protein [Serratia entomophila]CAI0995261.1 MbeD/MobD like [Serratia entomophila]CAI1097494.1 MbeD/MobD like [Serratia entomophila]CAI1116825.1 MbeD/MobD like [Serratia entomophila]CAI1155652.1 MbeD/MobD like [Serratia entomophila]